MAKKKISKKAPVTKKKSVKKQTGKKTKDDCPDNVCPIKKKNYPKSEQLSAETSPQAVSLCQRIFRFFCG